MITFPKTGPCSLDEVFFPHSSTSYRAYRSCYGMALGGNARYGEVDELCLDSVSKGSRRASLSHRDDETGLLMGALDFLEERTETSGLVQPPFHIWTTIMRDVILI